MAKPDIAKLSARAKEVVKGIETLTAERKKLYEEHDQIALALRGKKGLEKLGIRVVNAFEKGNTQWGHGPVRELTIELVEEKADAKKTPAKAP